MHFYGNAPDSLRIEGFSDSSKNSTASRFCCDSSLTNKRFYIAVLLLLVSTLLYPPLAIPATMGERYAGTQDSEMCVRPHTRHGPFLARPTGTQLFSTQRVWCAAAAITLALSPRYDSERCARLMLH